MERIKVIDTMWTTSITDQQILWQKYLGPFLPRSSFHRWLHWRPQQWENLQIRAYLCSIRIHWIQHTIFQLFIINFIGTRGIYVHFCTWFGLAADHCIPVNNIKDVSVEFSIIVISQPKNEFIFLSDDVTTPMFAHIHHRSYEDDMINRYAQARFLPP